MGSPDKLPPTNTARGATPMSAAGSARPSASSRFEAFERRQTELWRITFLLLLVLAVVFAWISWDNIRSLAKHYEALPIGLVVLIVLFGLYAWKRTQEISELRGLVRGLEQRDAAPPNEQQMNQLFEVILRSQQGYRDLIDAFDDVLLALTLDGEIRAANRSFADLVGATFQQIIGRRLDEFVEDPNGEERRRAEAALPRVTERRRWDGTLRIRFKNQMAPRFFDCMIHAMIRGDRVQGFTVLARDVTQQRESEARFTQLFETLQEGIYIASPEGAILDANPALVRMLGYASKEDLLRARMADLFFDPEHGTHTLRAHEERPLNIHEVVLKRKDGAPIHCLVTGVVVRDAFGKIERYQGALLDVSERREIEHRLHQQQEFARRLVDCFPDMILALDREGNYTFMSPSITEILGYESGQGFRRSIAEAVHEEDRAQLVGAFKDLLQGRQNFAALEARVRHRNGEWRVIRAHFSPLHDEKGNIEGVVVSGRDITALKRLEQQLIQSEKLAAMGQMLAGVAHELNNPLTAILGVSELLRDRLGLDEASRRQLDLTHRQARRAARIVQNLLEFSRPTAPQKKRLDVASLIERALQLQEHSLRRNNIAVDFRPESPLPPVLGDANQLIQVFLNLIINAEQAIREVRESGRIQVRLSFVGDRLAVVVQDDGVGVRPEALPRIFDPFYTTKRPGGGTGLGLSICMAILREHGGTIEAESLPAGGSAFTVYLPVVAGEKAAPGPADSGVHQMEATQRMLDVLKGRSVLVVDDEEGIRMLLQEGLSAQKIQVDSVASAPEALALAQHKPYDAVLCDLNLSNGAPDQSGEELARRIRSVAPGRPPFVVLMTGDPVEERAGAATEPGIRRIQKPFRISEVLSLLAELLAQAPVETLRS